MRGPDQLPPEVSRISGTAVLSFGALDVGSPCTFVVYVYVEICGAVDLVQSPQTLSYNIVATPRRSARKPAISQGNA